MKEGYKKEYSAWTGRSGEKFENEMLMPVLEEYPKERLSAEKELKWLKENQPKEWNPSDPKPN